MLRILCVGMGASPRDLPYFTILGRADQFFLGMLTAVLLRQGSVNIRLRKWLVPFSSALILAYLYGYNQIGGWEKVTSWKIFVVNIEGILFAFLIYTYTALEGTFNAAYSRIMKSLGTLSYSIYLLHFPILDFYSKHVFFRLLDNHYDNALLNMALVAPMVLAASALTYTFIEHPFLSLQRGYATPATIPAPGSRST